MLLPQALRVALRLHYAALWLLMATFVDQARGLEYVYP